MLFRKHIPSEIHRTYNLDFVSGIFSGLSLGLTVPFFAVIARRIGATPTQIAFMAAAPFVSAFFALYWAHLAERTTKKRHIFYAGMFSRAFLFGMLFIWAPFPFVIVVFISQFLTSLVIPAYAGIMNEIYPDAHRGKAMGYVRVGALCAMMIATYFGGRWLDAGSFIYRWAFPLGAIFGMAASYTFWRIEVAEKKNASAEAGFDITEIWRIFKGNSFYRNFELSYFIFGFGNLMSLPIYPLFVVDVLKLSNFTVGKLAAFSSIVSILGMIFWGRQIDKKGPFRLLGRNLLLISLIPALYCISRGVSTLYIANFFLGATFAGLELLMIATIIGISQGTNVPKYMACHTTFMGVRGTIAPFAGIALSHIIGLRGVFLVSTILIIIGGISVMRVFRGHEATG